MLDKFSHNTKILMSIEDITANELAKNAGISESTLGKMLSGKRKPNIETTMAVSIYFGVSIDDLLTKSIKACFY